MSEPTVIERLVAFHWNTLFHKSGPSWANVTSEKLRQQQTDAMLAAVRELREWLLANQAGTWSPSEQIGLIILEHERRSEGERG